jgi:hypothetical protein
MIFGAMNQGPLRPGHRPTNPICPFSTFSQAVAPSPAPRVEAASVFHRGDALPSSARMEARTNPVANQWR